MKNQSRTLTDQQWQEYEKVKADAFRRGKEWFVFAGHWWELATNGEVICGFKLKDALQIHEVPTELKAAFWDFDYTCEHLFKRVTDGGTINQETDIGSFGAHVGWNDYFYEAVLCEGCGEKYSTGEFVNFVRCTPPLGQAVNGFIQPSLFAPVTA